MQGPEDKTGLDHSTKDGDVHNTTARGEVNAAVYGGAMTNQGTCDDLTDDLDQAISAALSEIGAVDQQTTSSRSSSIPGPSLTEHDERGATECTTECTASSGAGADVPSDNLAVSHQEDTPTWPGPRLPDARSEACLPRMDATIGQTGGTDGLQPAFETVKRQVALYPYQQASRRRELNTIGKIFRADIARALGGFPPVGLLWDRGYPVAFSPGDIDSIQELTRLKFVRGGTAGGIKAVHEDLGLFLKFSFDQAGIYQSSRMAAKAAKREAAASRWVHAMDSVHVSTPLLECVDLTVQLADKTDQYRVIRVQAYSKVDFDGKHTLRVGSSDSAESYHVDAEQIDDVVAPLANHFCLAPYVRDVSATIVHEYECRAVASHSEQASSAAGVSLSGAVRSAAASAADCAADGSGKRCSSNGSAGSIFDFLGAHGLSKDVCTKLAETCSLPSDATCDGAGLTSEESELARAVFAAVRSSGADMDCVSVQRHDIQRKDRRLVGRKVCLQLPFDVEVHQLASGQRVVLDTHRLLIPDVSWLDWMKSNEARPRVWAVCSLDTSRVLEGMLDSFALNDALVPDVDPVALASSLNRWVGSNLSLLGIGSSEREPCEVKLAFSVADVEFNRDTGCMLAVGTSTDSAAKVFAVISCPRWYYSGNAALTCLLPPEAAVQLRKLDKGVSGFCPDQIMLGAEGDGGVSAARAAIAKLYENAESSGLSRYQDEVTIEVCKDLEFDPGVDHEKTRAVLKRAMHSLGLGLRHARLLLRDANAHQRHEIISALRLGSRSGSIATDVAERLHNSKLVAESLGFLSSPGTRQAALAAAALFASKGILMKKTEITSQCTAGALVWDRGSNKLLATGPSCVGTDLAADGGTFDTKPLVGATQLLDELAHIQKVGGTGEDQVLQNISEFGARSSGLQHLKIAARARAAAVRLRRSSAGTSLEYEAQFQDLLPYLMRICDCLRQLHDFGSAEAVLRVCLVLKPHTLGRQFHNTILNNLALCVGAQGRYEEAETMLLKCCDLALQADGVKGKRYATALNNLGSQLSSQGKTDQAIQVYQNVQTCMGTLHSKFSTEYATAATNLGTSLIEGNRADEGVAVLHEARQIQASLLGTMHPEYAATLESIAHGIHSLGQLDDAMKLRQECLSIRQAVFGKAHPHCASTLVNMALCLQEQKNHSEALRMLYESLEIYEVTIEKGSRQLIATKFAVAKCLFEMGRWEDAAAMYADSMANQPSKTVGYVNSMSGLALCHVRMENASKAVALLLQYSTGVTEADGLDVVVSLSNVLNMIAGSLMETGQLRDALQLLQESSSIYELRVAHRLGPDSASQLPKLKCNVAECLMQLRRIDEAFLLFKEFAEPLKKLEGAQSQPYAHVLAQMAACYMTKGQPHESFDLLEQARAVYRETIGTLHPAYCVTVNNMLQCCRRAGHAHREIELLKDLARSYSGLYGAFHGRSLEIKQRLVARLLEEGRVKEAEALMV